MANFLLNVDSVNDTITAINSTLATNDTVANYCSGSYTGLFSSDNYDFYPEFGDLPCCDGSIGTIDLISSISLLSYTITLSNGGILPFIGGRPPHPPVPPRF